MNPLKNLIFLTTKLSYIWENLSFFLPFWLGVTCFCLGLIYLLLKSSRKKRTKIIGFNLLLFIMLVNTIIFIGEVYFRFIFDYSDTLGNLKTSQRWLARHVISNADHFRDRNFSTQKDPKTTRIAILGDSFAWGWGVEAEERFSNLLEEKLNNPGRGNPSQGVTPRWEVYNTSTPGWESKNELEFLQTRAGLFQFDTIILSYVPNDIYNDRAFELPFYNPNLPKLRNSSLLKPIMDRSFFLEFFLVRALNALNIVPYEMTQPEMTLYRDEQSWKNHQQTLEKIIKHCRENKQKLIIIIFPYLDLVNQEPYPAAFVHEKLGKFFEEKGLKVIDLYPILKNYSLQKLRVNPFDTHPSKFVHQMVAELLYQEIIKL